MTREEAIEQLKVYRACRIADGADVEAYNMAIKALEQEPIIDKIRAEIEAYQADAFYSYFISIPKGTILKIIDKYRGESDCRECKVEHDCYECQKYAESEE